MKKIVEIDGMHCEHCAQRVTNALLEISGVKKVKVNLKKKKADIVTDNELLLDEVSKKISSIGFKVLSIK